MRTIVNDKLATNRGQSAKRGLIVGTVLLTLSVLGALQPRFMLPAYAVVLLGTVVTSWAGRAAAKWLGDLRGDRVLAKVLKGLDNRHRLYSYVLPAEHVLLSVADVFVLRVQRQDGKISCRGEKWRRHFHLQRLLGILSEERLGNPSKQARREAEQLRRFVTDHSPDVDVPIQPVIVFVNPRAELDVTRPTVPAVPLSELKRHLRHSTGDREMPKEAYRALARLFDEQAT